MVATWVDRVLPAGDMCQQPLMSDEEMRGFCFWRRGRGTMSAGASLGLSIIIIIVFRRIQRDGVRGTSEAGQRRARATQDALTKHAHCCLW